MPGISAGSDAGVVPASHEESRAASWTGGSGNLLSGGKQMLCDHLPKGQQGFQPFLPPHSWLYVRFRNAAGGSWTGPPSAKCYPNKLPLKRDPVRPPPFLPFPPSLPPSLPSFCSSVFPFFLPHIMIEPVPIRDPKPVLETEE